MRTVIQIDELLMNHNNRTKPPLAITTYLKDRCENPNSFKSLSYRASYLGGGNYLVRVKWNSNDSYGKVISTLSEFLISEEGKVTSFKNY